MSLFVPSDHTLTQGTRYLIVGGIAFSADFVCLWALTELGGLHYLLAAAIALTVGLCINYLLSVRWVFASRRFPSAKKEFLLFALIGFFTMLVGLILMWIFTEAAHIHYLASKLIVTAITLLMNFFIRKNFLFTLKRPV